MVFPKFSLASRMALLIKFTYLNFTIEKQNQNIPQWPGNTYFSQKFFSLDKFGKYLYSHRDPLLCVITRHVDIKRIETEK